MVDVVAATSDLTVFGGPEEIKLSVDFGSIGQRGSQIFTGPGLPGDAAVDLPELKPNDLYINTSPSSLEYLYLYKYGLTNGTLQWEKVIRLIPNTALINPIFHFINGEAHTLVSYNGMPVNIKGIYFPLGSFFDLSTVGNLSAKDLSVQHTFISSNPSATSLNINDISSTFDIEIFNPLTFGYDTVEDFNFGSLTLKVSYSAAELVSSYTTWTAVNGYRMIHFLATVGGRSTDVIDILASETTVNTTYNVITMMSHGLQTGDFVVYLSNSNTAIGGLTDSETYAAYRVDANNISLINIYTQTPIDITSTGSGTHSFLKIGNI